MAEPQVGLIEPEADDYTDELTISFTNESSTVSIASSIMKYREENGRTYHAYKDGKYAFPNDEVESDRLDLQHHLFSLTFDGKLFTAPVDQEKQFHRVLDVGTGTGIWAIDIADEHPESMVFGVDLSPIQPQFVPPNLVFQIDDLEEQWTFSHKFDFIYSRMMVGSFQDWDRFFAQSFENLEAGGFIELADICMPIECDDGTLPSGSALKKWGDCILEASIKGGRPINSPKSYKSLLQTAGFTDVVEKIYKWPTNTWPKDKDLKTIGLWQHENATSGLHAFSMALFTRFLGWSREEVENFCADVQKDLRDTKIHAYSPIYVVYARKPK
ncbi:S-adenosyl-L-methionine-dependent methyltransferase-3 [Coleophoma cylindrospora]|uniref:S-adenosyl-L-methionine-dependent methyltransferase-3 n=1 Tax=Coleophoma cylindrospora TaxID=1849047 RepID=A0A3D8QAN2_9HELO|nr:S-adenosyl-L-methionine-dependent methyltransferase-3 [Coleophoma cylindrospora]